MLPAAVYRKPHLYSVVPELEDIDVRLGLMKPRIPDENFSNVLSEYQAELANCSNIVSFYTESREPISYIMALEHQIMFANSAAGESLSNLIQQKIALLEAAYSNLISNNN
jgi:hypothetical protein